MPIFDKFESLREAYDRFENTGANPFNIAFEKILSPTEALLNGKPVLLLGTNNYLGLTWDEACITRSANAVQTFGTGTTGSRIANGSYDSHRALEAELADFYGRKHCMIFSTGYQANLGILSTLAGKTDHLILDADSHASIYDGARLGHAQVVRFRHNDPDDLYKRLRRLDGQPGDKIIVVEGIYSMLGDHAPLREFVQVKNEWGAVLIVDEAHSMGVLGETGRGLAEAEGVEDDVDFVIGTFSKSLGGVGGFCVSDMDGFDIMRVACRPYMFTASSPPGVIAATSEALRQLRKRPELRHALLHNAHTFYNGLREAGFRTGPEASPVVSAVMPDPETAMMFWRQLLARGIYVNVSMPPATPNGLTVLRSSVSAAHSDLQIRHAVNSFAAVAQEMGLFARMPAADEGADLIRAAE